MSLQWLVEDIETDNFLYKKLKELNKDVVLMNKIYRHDISKYYELADSYSGETIFIGSTGTMNRLDKEKFNIFIDDESFKYSYAMENHKFLLLNHDAIKIKANTLDFWEVKDCFSGGAVFIRPDSEFKDFSGQKVQKEYFKSFIEDNNVDSIDIFVSQPKDISQEWRCVMSDQVGFITGSEYYRDGNLYLNNFVPQEVIGIAEDIELPQDLYIVDVCKRESDGVFRVMEFNCFNTSGYYLSNHQLIIEAAEALLGEENDRN